MSDTSGDEHADLGAPVGRRVVLGLVAAGIAGIVSGRTLQNGLTRVLSPLESADPTGLVSQIPRGDGFRFYSVTNSVPRRTHLDYQLDVGGLVAKPATYSYSDLQSMPQTTLVRDFQCVTGWRVEQVHWRGVLLADLLDRVQPDAKAKAVTFQSFDGAYTESLTLDQARASDVLVALEMLGKPVTHDHGGPVRMYVAQMYGYKSTKWLSGIELTDKVVPGYWEERGYDINAFIGRSNGR